MDKVIAHEAKFIKELGTNKDTGLTIDKIYVSKKTGMPLLDNDPIGKSYLKNEAIHIAVLGKALMGDSRAAQVYSKNEAMEILTKKLTTLNSFMGRRRLSRDDQLAYWSVYGLMEILD